MITPDDGEAGAAGSCPVLDTRDRTESDLDECVKLMAEVHRRDGYPLRWPSDPGRFLSTSKIFAAWVATLDGQVVGHIGLSVVSPDDAAPRLLGVTCPAPANGDPAENTAVADSSNAASRGAATTNRGAGTASSGADTAGSCADTAGRGAATASSGAGFAGRGAATAGGAQTEGGSAAESGGVAAGSGSAAADAEPGGSDGVAMVSRLFVGTAARGYGAGRALMHRATQAAHERGLHLLLDVHSANTSAIALYERLGWNFLGTSRAQWGADQVTVLSYTAPPHPRALLLTRPSPRQVSLAAPVSAPDCLAALAFAAGVPGCPGLRGWCAWPPGLRARFDYALSCLAASALLSRRKPAHRSASSFSPIAAAASLSMCRQRRNPRFGSCAHGIGPCPRQPARRNWSRPR